MKNLEVQHHDHCELNSDESESLSDELIQIYCTGLPNGSGVN